MYSEGKLLILVQKVSLLCGMRRHPENAAGKIHGLTLPRVSFPATPPKEWKGESLGTQDKFLGCADIAFSIPELPIRRAFA